MLVLSLSKGPREEGGEVQPLPTEVKSQLWELLSLSADCSPRIEQPRQNSSPANYEGASMADLAQRLGISQGLCYRYFPSKQALLDCAVDQYAQQQVRILSPVLCDGTKSLRQRMLEMPAPEHYEAGGFYNAFHSESGRRMHQILSASIRSGVTLNQKSCAENGASRERLAELYHISRLLFHSFPLLFLSFFFLNPLFSSRFLLHAVLPRRLTPLLLLIMVSEKAQHVCR